MQKLVRGIHRLSTAEFRSSHVVFQLPDQCQRPKALLITCSDLPIDPFSLIPTNFADLYVLQNFGNLAGPCDPRQPDHGSLVEAAFAFYPLKDVVVCGHTSCDVMRNALAVEREEDAEIPWLATTLRQTERTRHIIAEHYGHLAGEPLLAAAIEENVLVQLENLRTIPVVASRLNRGDLYLHGWIYAGGLIFVYDPHQEQFAPLTQ